MSTQQLEILTSIARSAWIAAMKEADKHNVIIGEMKVVLEVERVDFLPLYQQAMQSREAMMTFEPAKLDMWRRNGMFEHKGVIIREKRKA